ncbi:hypothetical protein DUI87_17303 [Hirundo rustica rustica]|uniref:Uncharacterized protein n=1 Tax=Hirundo rustica rustica TaxID=333673 RepID=A0A3M0K3D9_HIRRU|nr:hypothetical protein DUI87_17303 [Hirundo rustica rustica]
MPTAGSEHTELLQLCVTVQQERHSQVLRRDDVMAANKTIDLVLDHLGCGCGNSELSSHFSQTLTGEDVVNSSVSTSVKKVAHESNRIWDIAEYTVPMQEDLWIRFQMFPSGVLCDSLLIATLGNFVLLASCCTSQSNENNENEESKPMCTGEASENHENEESEPMSTGESYENHHNEEYEPPLRKGASSPD